MRASSSRAAMTTEHRIRLSGNAVNSSNDGKRRTQRKCQSMPMVTARTSAAVPLKMSVIALSLIPQRFNRIEVGGFECGVGPKNYPDQRTDEQTNPRPVQRNGGRHFQE